MTIDEAPKDTNNHQKKITLICTGGRRWDVEFAGIITQRDIQKLYRILKVEFAKVLRRRSLKKMMARGAFIVTPKPVEAKIVTPTPTPTPTPTLTSQTKDMTDAS